MKLLLVLQYTTAKDGSVMGVTNTRSSMLCLCRTLTVACNYTEGENSSFVKAITHILRVGVLYLTL